MQSIEMMQLSEAGSISAYIGDTWNKIDLSNILLFFIYSFIELIMIRDPMIVEKKTYLQVLKPIIEFLVILISSLKFLYFMRIYSSMWLLVNLLIECAKDIQSFLLFLFFWVIVMSAMMVALNADYDEKDYTDL